MPSPRRELRLGDIASGLTSGWLVASPQKAAEINLADAYSYGDGLVSAAYSLLGSGDRKARARQQIYEKWQYMLGDPIISTAISLLTTSALGGHASSGDVIFIEPTATTKTKNKKLLPMVEEIARDLMPIFNRIAFQLAYQGAGFGDSYGRVYCEPGRGVVDVYVDEMVNPATMLPFEQGNRTVAFASCVGAKQIAKLSMLQVARLKMPRRTFVPQVSVTEKVWRTTLEQDDPNLLPVLPSAVGGSFLYEAETAFDNFYAALLGMVGQRVLDSVDESVLGVQMAGATREQQEAMAKSIQTMLKTSKKRAEDAVKQNRPILERIRHVLPIWNEKQVINFDMGSPSASKRSGNIGVDDVIFHARMVAGTFGTDLGLLGFADQMPASLGDGGTFRSSAMAAERARVIRYALADCFNHIINIHTYHRYGKQVFEETDRPWQINYYGSISALENERQATRERRMNGGAVLVQTILQAKEAGFTEEQMQEFLSKEMMLDEDQAKMFASVVVAQPGPGANTGGFDDFGNPNSGGGQGPDPIPVGDGEE